MYETIGEQFAKMGARVRIRPPDRRRFQLQPAVPVRLDVASDRRGEFFDIAVDEKSVSLEILDVQPKRRHLVVMARYHETNRKDKFLCGHDERAWFVAAVPPGSAANVRTAIESLKPAEVHAAQAATHIRRKDRNRRRTAAYVRQGEWFFVPAPDVNPPATAILRNEPLRRGAGKPHVVEFVYRSGGETVYVCPRRPNGLTEEEYAELLRQTPKARTWGWHVMRRDPNVYAKGRVRHSDHRTVILRTWHRVFQNAERLAPAMRNVAFLD